MRIKSYIFRSLNMRTSPEKKQGVVACWSQVPQLLVRVGWLGNLTRQQVMACISYSSLTSTSSPSFPSSSMAAWWTNDLPIILLVAIHWVLTWDAPFARPFPAAPRPSWMTEKIEPAAQNGGLAADLVMKRICSALACSLRAATYHFKQMRNKLANSLDGIAISKIWNTQSITD